MADEQLKAEKMNTENQNDLLVRHLEQREEELRMKQQRNEWMIRAFSRLCTILLGIFFGVMACLFLAGLTGCSAPRTVEEHHHHYYQADTAAVSAQVDQRLQSWHTEMDSAFRAFTNQYNASMAASEQEQELISELITVSTDSVGRTIRQEQRTVKRDITRELQQQEQRITEEYEVRMRACIDSVSDLWSQRYDSLASHVQQLDSLSSIIPQPSSLSHHPWYRRLWDHLQWLLIGAALGIGLWVTKKWWLKIIRPV